jgi:hypothetical protein
MENRRFFEKSSLNCVIIAEIVKWNSMKNVKVSVRCDNLNTFWGSSFDFLGVNTLTE